MRRGLVSASTPSSLIHSLHSGRATRSPVRRGTTWITVLGPDLPPWNRTGRGSRPAA